ncbi:MAG: hypothetical protein EOP04_27040 [Proteobacteria bacterium]|nr:MAG: hypothetical protein EOP04_27040 [Pseudomonadota bacterium]
MRTIAAAITGNEQEMRAQLEAALKIDPTNTRYLEVQKALDEKRTPEFDLKADLFGMPVN